MLSVRRAGNTAERFRENDTDGEGNEDGGEKSSGDGAMGSEKDAGVGGKEVDNDKDGGGVGDTGKSSGGGSGKGGDGGEPPCFTCGVYHVHEPVPVGIFPANG